MNVKPYSNSYSAPPQKKKTREERRGKSEEIANGRMESTNRGAKVHRHPRLVQEETKNRNKGAVSRMETDE